LTYIEQHSPTGVRSAARKAKRTVVGTLVASLLVAVPVGSAGATSVGSTRAEIATLRAQIDAGASQIHQLVGAYADASAEATSLRQQLGTQYLQLSRLRRELGGSQLLLRRAAVASYTGSAGASSEPDLATEVDPAVGSEYLTVASGDVAQSIDVYQLRQRQVATEISTIRGEQQANTTDLRVASNARSGALAAAEADQGRLATLENDLSRQLAAATPATQGLPVNNGLVRVAAAGTAPTSAPVAPSPAPSSPAPSSPATTPATAAPPTTTPAGGAEPPATTAPTTAPPTTTPPTAPPTTAPPTTAPPTTAPPSGGGGAGGVWLQLRDCESGDNYAENSGNGYFGAYQFSATTWTSLGYPGRPDLEPPAMQDAAAMRLQAQSGWGQWPACAAALGLT
jgi:hypothetical protein